MPSEMFTDAVSIPFPLCVLGISLAELSLRLQMAPFAWSEPGMGPALGLHLRLQSGENIFLEEYEHISRIQSARTTIYVEARSIMMSGIQPLLAIVLSDLQLSAPEMVWVQTEKGLEGAQSYLDFAKTRDDAFSITEQKN